MTRWKLVPVEPDDSTLSAMHEKMYDVRGLKWHDGMSAVYMAGVNAAPQPPKLSDERILELAARAEAQWNAVVDQYNQWGQLGFDEIVILISRAIEREILEPGS